MTTDNHSQHEANKLVRVLNDTPLRYTVRVYHADGRVTEWQSDHPAKVKWHEEARALWIQQGDYEYKQVMPWTPGDIILMEENPKK